MVRIKIWFLEFFSWISENCKIGAFRRFMISLSTLLLTLHYCIDALHTVTLLSLTYPSCSWNNNCIRSKPVLYQVLNKQVRVPVPVHKAQVPVQVPAPILCINYQHKVTQHKVKVVVVCHRFNIQLVFWNTTNCKQKRLLQTPVTQSMLWQ